jgi:hypothetical protein
MESLAPHVNVIVSLLSLLFLLLLGAIGVIFKMLLSKIDCLGSKMDLISKMHTDCMVSLPVTYLNKREFDSHSHVPENGRVVRGINP